MSEEVSADNAAPVESTDNATPVTETSNNIFDSATVNNNEAVNQDVNNEPTVVKSVEQQAKDARLEQDAANAEVGKVNWYETLSDEVRNIEGFDGIKDKFKDVDAVVAAYINAQKLIGKKSEGVKLPDENSSPEDVAAFYNQLGRPEGVDGYEWSNKPDDFELDEGRLADRNTKLHELGITQKQYDGLMDIYAEEYNMIQDNWLSNEQSVMDNTVSNLKEAWGDKYDQRIQAAASIADKFGVKEALMESGVVNHQPVIEMLYKVHQATSEDGVIKTPDSGYSRDE